MYFNVFFLYIIHYVLHPNIKTLILYFAIASVTKLTSRLRAGSQQIDHVQVVADVDQDL